MKFHLATRKSPLAMWQADTTATQLRGAWSDLEPEPLQISSSGDIDRSTDLARFGRIGIFTVEVDRALFEGRAQVAVHSLKDMVTTLDDGLELVSVLGRGPVQDALISREGQRLDELAEGARVATGSRRRAAMLKAARPDLQVVGIRGNVGGRLDKLERGEADALIMASAGLERLGLGERITQVFDTEQFLPAVGQGIVGLVCLADDEESKRRMRAITDMEAWHEALAERALLRELRGGCNVPVGGHARAVEDHLVLKARVLSLDGSVVVQGMRRGLREDAEAIGLELAQELNENGARELIEAARVDAQPNSNVE